MAHPMGGFGSRSITTHSFKQAHAFVGSNGLKFPSTTGEQITASRGFSRDMTTETIVFVGERNRHGSVCEARWGFPIDCNQSRIGHCVRALDAIMRQHDEREASTKPILAIHHKNDREATERSSQWSDVEHLRNRVLQIGGSQHADRAKRVILSAVEELTKLEELATIRPAAVLSKLRMLAEQFTRELLSQKGSLARSLTLSSMIKAMEEGKLDQLRIEKNLAACQCLGYRAADLGHFGLVFENCCINPRD